VGEREGRRRVEGWEGRGGRGKYASIHQGGSEALKPWHNNAEISAQVHTQLQILYSLL
jgi:hypothetical protein